jgi:hypothetical protein
MGVKAPAHSRVKTREIRRDPCLREGWARAELAIVDWRLGQTVDCLSIRIGFSEGRYVRSEGSR